MTNEQGGRSLVLPEIVTPSITGVGEPLNPANLTNEADNLLQVLYNGVPTEIHKVPTNFKLNMARWLDDMAGASQDLDLDSMAPEERAGLSMADLLRHHASQTGRKLPISQAILEVGQRYGDLSDVVINMMQVQRLIAELVTEAKANFALSEAESKLRWKYEDLDEVSNATQQLYWSGYYEQLANRLHELVPDFDPRVIYT